MFAAVAAAAVGSDAASSPVTGRKTTAVTDTNNDKSSSSAPPISSAPTPQPLAPPVSFVLAAALRLLDTPCPPPPPSDDGREQTSTISTTANSDNKTPARNAWGPTARTTAAAAVPPPPPTRRHHHPIRPPRDKECVYLLPRPYLQNWIDWASSQPVPDFNDERSRLDDALARCAVLHGLDPPEPRQSGEGRGVGGGGAPTSTSSPSPSSGRSPSLPPVGRLRLDSDPAPPIGNGKTNADFDAGPATTERRHLLDPGPIVASPTDDSTTDEATGPDDQDSATMASSTSTSSDDGRGGRAKRVTPVSTGQATSGTDRSGRRVPRVPRSSPTGRLPAGQSAARVPRDPGPIDASPLSVWGHPLLLRPGVVVGKGDSDGGYDSTVVENSRFMDRGPDDVLSLVEGRGRLDGGSSAGAGVGRGAGRVGCCAVPELFYELIRSTHGVLCDDSETVSFQPGPPPLLCDGRHVGVGGARNGGAGKRGGGGGADEVVGGGKGGEGGEAALHRHVLRSSPPRRKAGEASGAGGHLVDISHPSSTSGRLSPHSNASQHLTALDQPRPVEFRRRILPVAPPPLAVYGPVTGEVEVNPVRIVYSVVGGGTIAAPRIEASASGSVASGASAPSSSRGSGKASSSSSSRTGTSRPGEPDAAALLRGAASRMQREGGGSTDAPAAKQRDKIGGGGGGREEGFLARRNRRLEQERRMDEAIAADGTAVHGSTGDHPSAFSPHGFVLCSRASTVVESIRSAVRAAAPDRSNSCARAWYRSAAPGLRSGEGGATVLGDGYDLVDIESLEGAQEPMTLREWARKLQPRRRPQRRGSTENGGDGDDEGRGLLVEILVEVRSSPTAKWPREKLELENRVQVGDFVDAQDSQGKWYEAIVRNVTEETVTVHYLGWGSRWDSTIRRRRGVCPANVQKTSPPAPLWSHTSRWREEVNIGQEVEVREACSLVNRPKWFRARVTYVGGEGDALREIVGGAELEALEESEESNSPQKTKHALLLLHRTRQVMVEVPQEKFNVSTPIPPSLPSAAVSASDPSAAAEAPPTARPPFIRWVQLYGEEICEANTHNRPEPADKRPATIRYAHDPSRPPVEVLRSFNNVHGAGFVRESMRGVPPAPGSVGLHNLGNSCFLNSIVQCMTHIDPITQYFLKGDYRVDINRKNPLGSGGRVAFSYAALLNDMWGGEYSTLAPRMLKQTVGSFAPQFNNSYQHDSQEFCSFLMDGIHEDLNRVKEKPYVEDFEGYGMEDLKVAIESWRKHLLRHDSIIVDHCQGMHRSHLTCPRCGKESIKFDIYSSISLPLVQSKDRPSVPLSDCLDDFTSGEQLDERNAWYCDKCKEHVCALKLITLWSTPDILILHLKRFTFDSCSRRNRIIRKGKIEDKVDFPIDNLDMSPYVLGPIDKDAPPVYKLFGVSEHSGSTANSGHYTATVRNSRDGKWYRYNDSHVGMTSGDASVTGGAYLLFYQRKKGSARWAGMEKVMKERQVNPYGPIDEDQDGFKQVKSRKKRK